MGTVYFIEWNLGLEYWNGVQSWRQTLEWIARLYSDKAMPYFIEYQDI